MLALALLAGACGKKADTKGDANVPEVAAAGVPDVPSGSSDVDTRELERYQLTMADFRKWAAVQEKSQAYAQQHPEIAKDKESSKFPDSLDEIEALVERNPEARRLVESSGLSVHQYAVITFAILQASIGQLLVQQGQTPDSVAREFSIHPANVTFVKDHEKEIAKLNRVF